MDPSDEIGQQASVPGQPQPGAQTVPFPAVPQVSAAASAATPGIESGMQPGQPAGQAGGQSMTLPLPPNPLSGNAPMLNQIDVTPTTQMATPQVIDDGDVIEKEWVSKAKQIVARNRNDPYKQSQELMVLRADYMQKRYNKAVKLSE
jgi:hypothetical protein